MQSEVFLKAIFVKGGAGGDTALSATNCEWASMIKNRKQDEQPGVICRININEQAEERKESGRTAVFLQVGVAANQHSCL